MCGTQIEVHWGRGLGVVGGGGGGRGGSGGCGVVVGGGEAGREVAFKVSGEVVLCCYGRCPAGGGCERVFGHSGEAPRERRVGCF